MDIGSVLSRAWQIIWRNKVLWIFGILAGCTNAGQSAGNNLSGRSRYELNNQDFQNFLNRLNISDEMAILIGLIAVLVVLILAVLFIFLGTIGRIGLIRGATQADGGQARLVFGDLFSGSMPYFWRVFGLSLLIFLIVILVAILSIVPIIVATVTTLGLIWLCLAPLMCLLIPLGWFISIIIEQSTIAIVVDNLSILDGLNRGWDMVRKNLGTMLVMGLILFLGVALIGGLLIGLPMFLFVIPAALGIATQGNQSAIAGLAITVLCIGAYLPIALILNGILTSYTETAWTLTYLRLSGRRPELVEPVSAI